MHKVRVVGIKTLETGKFNAELAEMENPCKGTIKFSKEIPLTIAGAYNNSEAWLFTDEEKRALTEGKDWIMPETVKQQLKILMAAFMDLLNADEGKVDAGMPEAEIIIDT